MIIRAILVFVLFLLVFGTSYGQNTGQLPEKFLKDVQEKSAKIDRKVTRSTDKMLSRFQQQEQKMRSRMARIDSTAAKKIFDRSIDSLGHLKADLLNRAPVLNKFAGGYNGYLDTVTNALDFLKGADGLVAKSKGIQAKLGKSVQSVKELQSKLQTAEEIKNYVRQRRQELQQQLSQYTAFSKDLKKLNKQAFYYAQQVREYREILKDRGKAERKALELLQQSKAFNSFLERNSRLAGLFNINSGLGGGVANLEQSLAGLQTRNQVEALIQQRMSGGGPNAGAALSEQMEAARAQFDELKKRFPDVDNAEEMPDFKPNEMKTKSFLQRLEFGGNVQFQRAQKYFPTTGDIAGQVAYKFHTKASAGLGVAYKFGMGTGWDNIAFSHQGVGFRSFLDWKIKYDFYINGGFEQNYNKPFGNMAQLQNASAWSGSGLVGLSKKYKISAKLKGNAILLYDFLADRQVPKTSPFKFRIGYAL